MLEEVFYVLGCGGGMEELPGCELGGVLRGLSGGADGGHVEGCGGEIKGPLRGGDEGRGGEGGACKGDVGEGGDAVVSRG